VKITIVTVTYNVIETIEATIKNVINQEGFDDFIEYIIVDGASSDGTVDIIKKYEKYITWWKSEPDNGLYEAMNKGVQHATGEYIYFLNSGDLLFDKNTIKKVIEKIQNTKDDIFYGDVWLYEFKTKNITDKRKIYLKEDKSLNFQFTMPLGHQGVFVPTSIMKKIKFKMSLKIAADYEQLYNCFHRGLKFRYIGVDIAKFDIFGKSNMDRFTVNVEGLYIVNFYDGVKAAKESAYWYVLMHKYNIRSFNDSQIINIKEKYTGLINELMNLKDIKFIRHPLRKFRLYKKIIRELKNEKFK